MSDDLREKLVSEVEETDWAPLKQHHDHGAVFIVEGLDLLDAAVAVAQDRVDFVKVWLDTSALRKPSDEEVKAWDADKNTKMAKFIIIQPYVLIQLVK